MVTKKIGTGYWRPNPAGGYDWIEQGITALPRSYATSEQFNLIKKFQEEGTLGLKQLTKDLLLTGQQAIELGFRIPETDDLLFSPISPREGELYGRFPWLETSEVRTIKDTELSDLLSKLYPEKIKPLPSADEDLLFKEYQRTGGQYDLEMWRMAGTPLRPEMEFEYLTDLSQRATLIEGEDILRSLGATEEVIDQFVGLEKREEEFVNLIQKNFPEYKTIEEFGDFYETNPDLFVSEIQAIGRTRSSENLLRIMGFTGEDIERIIPFPAIGKPEVVVSEEGKWWTLDFWKDAFFKPYGGKDLKGKAAASFVAGIGDVISTTGGAARWLGYEDAGGVLSAIGSTLQKVAPPDTLGEFEVGDLLNPEFYATKITRTIPFSLSLLPLAIAGYGGGAAVATAIGLGRIASAIVGGLAGAALSRPLESAMEAGGAYDDAIARGKSEKEAKDEADKVFRDNMVMAGADAFEIAIALSPTPKWVPSSLVKAGLVRTARIGGKMVIVGLSEGGEEVYQDMVTRHARGEEWQLDPVSKEVFAIGAVMGLGMGLGGDVVSGIVNKAKTQMSVPLKRQFDQAVLGFKKDGFRLDQSELKALDAISQTPEGEGLVNRLIREAREQARIAPERGAVEIPGKKPEEVTPAPEVTKPTTAPYPQEAIDAFRQAQIRTAQDMSAHGGSVSDIAKELKVSQQYVSELLAAKPAIPKEVTPVTPEVTAENQAILKQIKNALVTTDRLDEVSTILPDGAALTGREFKGIGAFQHLAEDLPSVERWLDAGAIRAGLEANGTFFVEIRGGITQKQFATLNKLMQDAPNVRVDFGYFEKEITKSFEGSPNIVRNQLRELVGTPGFLKGYGIPKAEIPKVGKIIPKEVTPAPGITAKERLQQFAIKKDPISAARQLGYEVHKLSPKDTVDAGAYSEGYRYRLSKPREGQPYPDIVMAKNEKEIGDYLVRQRAIPKAEAAPAQTWTEAGIQPSMLPEDVAAIEVRPPAKGKITQISMDDQLKLEQARQAAEEAPEETQEAYEAQWEIEGLKAVHQIDPVVNKKIWIGKSKKGVDLYAGLDSLIFTKEGETPSYYSVKQAKLLAPNHDWSFYTQKGLKTYNKVPSDAVLDDMATELGFEDAQGLINRINQIRKEKRQIKELERQSAGVEAGLPYLSVPEETTLPMPEEVTASEDRVVMPPPPPKEPPPPEPPPTHPPQPAPIEAGRITMPDLQAPQTVVDMYSRPDLWRRIANLPLVRKAVGLFNPAAVANNPAKQAIILRAALKDEGAQKAQAVMSHLWEIGTQERVWGKTDEYGYLKAEAFAGFTMDDIRTNPTKFLAEMTEQQREWIKRASEIEKIKLEALKRNGVDINELSFEDGGEYAGRRVMGKFNDAGELIESGRIGIGGRVGAKMPFEKTRVFKTAEEGILANYRYMNTDEALYYNTLGAYFKIADRQMADWILSKVDWRTTKAPEALVLQAEAARLRLRKAQQLAAALNRAVRGERVPSNTINSIATVFPDQADTLKNLIPELQKPSPETADTVQILTAEAKALISEARLEYYQAVNERARAREEAMRVKYEEASIAHPAFAGKIFTGAEAKEIADILNRGLTPQFIEVLGEVNKVNAIGRFFMLAGDASPMAIQLQFLAFYRPAAYAKAMGGFVRAMFDPEFQYRYYANNRDLINRHPTLILSGRGTEFTEFMGRGGLGKKLGVLAKPLVPFQKAFEGSLDVAGIELAKSLDHLATTAERTLEVDQFINEFRGITSSARIGVSSTQRQVETAIFLAPRYNRAIATYLFDIVHGGVRGELARMSLAQGFAGLAAMAVAISIALGEDEDEIWEHFNNESPMFFTWDVFGVKVGLGGKVRSILKTFGNMTRTGEIGQPALNFLRANLSPGASTGLDLLTGKNYIGEPTRDNVLDFSKTVLRNFMMIWTQTFLMEGGTLKDKAIIATAEFLGWRGYDISAKKELKIKDLEELLGETIGKTPVLTKKKPDIWDTRNMYSAVKRILERERPEDVLADKGYAGWGHLVVKIQQSEANSLPNIAFKDYNFDKEKGDTLADYMEQWAERQRIIEAGERAVYVRVKIVEGKEERTTFKGLQALVAHKVDYPNAQRGNLSKRDRELLLEYNAAVDKKQFIKDHPEIKVNKLTEWLKAHPRENAELALVGQADILSKEAYNQYKKLIVEMDITDAALLKNVLPPETSLDTHFSYVDMVAKGIHGSWEAQLLLKQDYMKAHPTGKVKEGEPQSYTEWRTKEGEQLKLSDTPIASLKLKTEKTYRETYLKLDDEDYLKTLEDTLITASGMTEKDTKIAELHATKIGDMTWIDIDRKIKAIEMGTEDNPTPDDIITAQVDYMKIQDGVSPDNANFARGKLAQVDQTGDIPKLNAYGQWRLDNAKALGITDEPMDLSQVAKWNIDVNYEKEDAEYKAILDKYEGREETQKTDEYMASHETYRKDNRRREAYGLSDPKTGEKFPLSEVENYVIFNELLLKGKRRDRLLIDNPFFADAMHRIKGIDIPKPEDVPAVQYDDIYDQYKDDFDRWDGLDDYKKTDFYIEDPVARQQARDSMMFNIVVQTYSGMRIPNEQLTEFGLAYYRREAYGNFVSEEYVEDYVGWRKIQSEGKPAGWEDYTDTDKWYEDDWYMMEHLGFYRNVYLNPRNNNGKQLERWDFGKVPTREIFSKYLYYEYLTTKYAKDQYRVENRDLDEWGVRAGIWEVTMTEKKRRLGLTPVERIEEEIEALIKGLPAIGRR